MSLKRALNGVIEYKAEGISICLDYS